MYAMAVAVLIDMAETLEQNAISTLGRVNIVTVEVTVLFL